MAKQVVDDMRMRSVQMQQSLIAPDAGSISKLQRMLLDGKAVKEVAYKVASTESPLSHQETLRSLSYLIRFEREVANLVNMVAKIDDESMLYGLMGSLSAKVRQAEKLTIQQVLWESRNLHVDAEVESQIKPKYDSPINPVMLGDFIASLEIGKEARFALDSISGILPSGRELFVKRPGTISHLIHLSGPEALVGSINYSNSSFKVEEYQGEPLALPIISASYSSDLKSVNTRSIELEVQLEGEHVRGNAFSHFFEMVQISRLDLAKYLDSLAGRVNSKFSVGKEAFTERLSDPSVFSFVLRSPKKCEVSSLIAEATLSLQFSSKALLQETISIPDGRLLSSHYFNGQHVKTEDLTRAYSLS